MELIAAYLRTMQLYAHNAHNLVKGPVFNQDHDVLGELYPVYEAAYDSVVERMIGLGQPVDLLLLQQKAVEMLKAKPANVPENKAFLEHILMCEKELCKMIEQLIASSKMSEGTRQMLGGLADESEMRQYKLGQRVKK